MFADRTGEGAINQTQSRNQADDSHFFTVRLLSELILCQPFAFVKRSRAWKNSTMPSLFDSESLPSSREPLQEGAVLLRGFVLAEVPTLLEEVGQIAQAAPFRHLVTPGGYTMSVAMTNCGSLGWVTDRAPMPEPFTELAQSGDGQRFTSNWAAKIRVGGR